MLLLGRPGVAKSRGGWGPGLCWGHRMTKPCRLGGLLAGTREWTLEHDA